MSPRKRGKNSLIKIFIWPFKSYMRIMAVVIAVGIYQYQSIQIDILARDIRDLELKRNQLQNSNTSLQVKIDQLTHINRIEKIAREKFNLVAAGSSIEKLVIDPYTPDIEIRQEEEMQKVKLAGVP